MLHFLCVFLLLSCVGGATQLDSQLQRNLNDVHVQFEENFSDCCPISTKLGFDSRLNNRWGKYVDPCCTDQVFDSKTKSGNIVSKHKTS